MAAHAQIGELLFISVTAALLLSCGKSVPTGPPGYVTLRYSGTENSDMLYVLDNRTKGAISFRGSRSRSGNFPLSASTTCEGGLSAESETENVSFGDGLHRPSFEAIQVTPEETMQLTIVQSSAASHHKGGICYLRLVLQDGSSIESNRFKP